jgi:hypothetical protein
MGPSPVAIEVERLSQLIRLAGQYIGACEHVKASMSRAARVLKHAVDRGTVEKISTAIGVW